MQKFLQEWNLIRISTIFKGNAVLLLKGVSPVFSDY